MTQADLQLTHIPSAKVGMLIRRPPDEVFRAFVDPAITTKFWSPRAAESRSRGRRRRVHDGGVPLHPWEDGATTYVEVTESGLRGNGDELVARVAGSTGGFSLALSAAKALLEHDVVLTLVRDRFPKGVEH